MPLSAHFKLLGSFSFISVCIAFIRLLVQRIKLFLQLSSYIIHACLL